MKCLTRECLWIFLHEMLSGFPRSAMVTASGETLYLSYETLGDIGTLPQSIEIANQYLKLQDGDIVLTNDPYSGGTVLASPTLIIGVSEKGSGAADYLIASRLTTAPRISQGKTVDDEGLRIPPSPIVVRGERNKMLLDALAAHPKIPLDLIAMLSFEIDRLLDLRTQMKKWLATGFVEINKNSVKEFFDISENRMVRALEEFRDGDTVVEYRISPKETIKLKTELHEGHLKFDFSGTSAGANIFLTAGTTLGTCMGATLASLRGVFPLNTGVFRRFEVSAPKGSLVNAAFPQPVTIGHTDGANIVAQIVMRSLGQIDERFITASSGYSHCHFEIEFADGRVFVGAIPAGVGASPEGGGLSAANIWRRHPQRVYQSLEHLEKAYPIEVLAFGFRANSGGEGKYKGGDGGAFSIKVNSPGKLRWFYLEPEHKPEGAKGGRTALGPVMNLQLAKGEKKELAAQGETSIPEGTIINVLAPGGGGFGTPPTPNT